MCGSLHSLIPTGGWLRLRQVSINVLWWLALAIIMSAALKRLDWVCRR